MELEQRVQALEQEVQLLKSQIQAILLDIQEQLLTNAYPSLRTQEAHLEMPGQPSPASTNGRESAPVRNVKRVVLEEGGDGDDEPAPPFPAKVTQPRRLAPEPRHEASGEMEQWVSDKIEEVGVKHTRRLIDVYAERGEINPDEQQALLHLVALHEENSGSKPRRNGSTAFQRVEVVPEPRREPSSEMAQWVSDKIKEVGIKNTRRLIDVYVQRGEVTPEEQDALLQLVTLYEEANAPKPQRNGSTAFQRVEAAPPAPSAPRQPARPQPSARPASAPAAGPQATIRPKTSARTNPATRPQQPNTPPPAVQSQAAPTQPTSPQPPARSERMTQKEQSDAAKSSIVLRLIAGVQNAGAGVRWHKHNG